MTQDEWRLMGALRKTHLLLGGWRGLVHLGAIGRAVSLGLEREFELLGPLHLQRRFHGILL